MSVYTSQLCCSHGNSWSKAQSMDEQHYIFAPLQRRQYRVCSKLGSPAQHCEAVLPPAKKAPARQKKSYLPSAIKSAPPVRANPAVKEVDCSELIDEKHDAALSDRLNYRGQLEELLSSSTVSTTPWWESLFPFLSSPRIRGILLLNVLTFLYGTNIPIVKGMEETISPSLFLCGRFAIATMVFAPYVARGMRDTEVRNASLELGLWISMGYATQSISLLTTDAGRASFIAAFTVIAVPLLAGLSGRKISNLTWASAIIAFVGVGLLETSGSPASVGDVWSFFSAVLFGVHMLRTEHYSRSISSTKLLPMLGVQLLVMTLSSLLGSAITTAFLKGVSLPNLQDIHAVFSWQSISHIPWLPLVYTGTVSTAVCLWIEMTAMKDISAMDAAVIYSLEPLWGATFAWCFLGERWGLKGWMGALLILGGSLAVQSFQAQDEVSGADISKET